MDHAEEENGPNGRNEPKMPIHQQQNGVLAGHSSDGRSFSSASGAEAIVCNERRPMASPFNCNARPGGRSTGEPPLTDEGLQLVKDGLVEQLEALRMKRDDLQRTSIRQHLDEWMYRFEAAKQSYDHTLSTLESATAKRIWIEEQSQYLSKIHVFGETSLIWYKGPFGTINGFRLGRSAVTVAGLLAEQRNNDKAATSGARQQQQQQQAGRNGDSLFGQWVPSDAAANVNNSQHTSGQSQSNVTEIVTVPWTEINSALGQVVFMLSTVQNLSSSGISFGKHILQPTGSSSKIGIVKKMQTNQEANGGHRTERRRITALSAYYNAPLPGEVTWYNLHHYEESGSILSMGYYARRNFNVALDALLYCVAKACLVVQDRDMALAAPYVMRVGGLVVGKDAKVARGGGDVTGDATLGGLPFSYDPAHGEQWTLVCKYLLTNLKWLIAYFARWEKEKIQIENG